MCEQGQRQMNEDPKQTKLQNFSGYSAASGTWKLLKNNYILII